MSRLDATDFDCSSRLSALRQRSSGSWDHVNGYSSNLGLASFTPQQDRRSSTSLGVPTYPVGVSRSIGAQEREFSFGMSGDTVSLTNRHNANTQSSISSLNYNTPSHRPSPPLSQHTPSHLYSTSTPSDRDAHTVRNTIQPPPPSSPQNLSSSRSTLWWGDLEPWMDEEYVKQVCSLMGWDSTNILVPRPPPESITGQQANNPGYCFITFPSPAHAASALSQINNGGNNNPPVMPNSTKAFLMNWTSNVPSASPVSYPALPAAAQNTSQAHQYQKEYSIFVGDLAPETSNSDLVAVFRNPVLGLRNDREPKFIRPFLSCKSAKIMLDPVTGVSRGYGFVRFTDEGDQQRALIEMHGLYCLSRPMRISPATAKYKLQPSLPAADLPQVQYPSQNAVTLALALPKAAQNSIVSTNSSSSLASNVVSSSSSGSNLGGSNSGSSLSSSSTSSGGLPTPLNSHSSEDMAKLPNTVLAQIAQQYANSDAKGPTLGVSVTSQFAQDNTKPCDDSQRYLMSEELWKHQAQARAILGNLMGPNGEQLTSADPYNTTVFVGGLSPLISEETLRTFFTPFGDIHYVKVPAGKHCGFVQFVRKADAERAIEKMQGFPIAGSRIRLSWGRSQYKAAQAAAQAAQAAALQAQYQANLTQQEAITQEQALQILQKFTVRGYLDNPLPLNTQYNGSGSNNTAPAQGTYTGSSLSSAYNDPQSRSGILGHQSLDSYSTNGFLVQPNVSQQLQSNFSPFSPDPNTYGPNSRRNETNPYSLPHPSRAYAPGFSPMHSSETKPVAYPIDSDTSINPSTTDPSSGHAKYGGFLEASNIRYSQGRPDVTSSRRSSGSTSGTTLPERNGNHSSDPMQDLNGTLASLDLDREKPWRSHFDTLDQSRPIWDEESSP